MHGPAGTSIFAALFLAAGGFAPAGEGSGGEYRLDLSAAEPGSVPEGLFVLDGTFAVGVAAGVKALEMAPEPLTEGLVLLGDTLRGGGSIRARVEAKRRARSFPSFGVGLHGISGHRLRVVPARRVVEVVFDEESVAEKPFAWSDEHATWLELKIFHAGEGKWTLEGRVWSAGAEEPAEPLVSLPIDGERLSGKGVLSAAPYAGLPIRFLEVRIQSAPAQPAAAGISKAGGKKPVS